MLAAGSVPPPPRRFSLTLTVFFSIIVFFYVIALPLSLPVIEGRLSPLSSLERPADTLERIVSREMDLRAVVRGHPWEWWLYTMLSGGDDPIDEATAWYAELLEMVDVPSAQLYHRILLAESDGAEGTPEPGGSLEGSGELSARMAGWLDAAYGASPPEADSGRALIGEIRSELPTNWFSDTLVARIAARAPDAAAQAQAESAIAARGRDLLVRMRLLVLFGLTLLALGMVALGRALAPRLHAQVAAARVPPDWPAGDGYALFVRGLGAPQAVMFALIFLVRRELPLDGVISMAADLPLFWWVGRYLSTRGRTMRETFGLAPMPGGGRALVGATLILAAVAITGDALIDWAGHRLGIASHWSEGFSEPMLWESRWPLLGDIFNVVIWAPLVEELTFRGLLYGTLRTRLAPWPAALVSAAIFALPHGYGVLGSASVLMSGLLWAFAYERTRSLLPGLLAHCINNFMSTLWVVGILRL